MLIIILVLVAIVVGLICLFVHDPKFIWKMLRWFKWQGIKSQVANITSIHNRTVSEESTINVIKNIQKSIKHGEDKKSLAESKKAYVQYIDFCNAKGLSLPSNYNQTVSLIVETEDILDPGKALDRELERASRQYDEMYTAVNRSGEALLKERRKSVGLIVQAEKVINNIAKHPKSYDLEIADIQIRRQQFKSAIEYAKEQQQALKTSASNTIAGVAIGAGTASLAPTAAMWVATTFGTASTGTAISALSGAAASNAAIAWIGGGALAAGGGGMAAGQALLLLVGPIGVGIAGISIFTAVVMFWRKRIHAEESKKDEIARIKNCTEVLKETKGKIDALLLETTSLERNLSKQIKDCRKLKNDYTSLDSESQMQLGTLVNNVRSLSELLNKTVVTDEKQK